MARQILIKANRLPSGVTVVEYTAGRIFGAVMFDAHGRFEDATRKTASHTAGRGFCDRDDLPAGVLNAAREAVRQ